MRSKLTVPIISCLACLYLFRLGGVDSHSASNRQLSHDNSSLSHPSRLCGYSLSHQVISSLPITLVQVLIKEDNCISKKRFKRRIYLDRNSSNSDNKCRYLPMEQDRVQAWSELRQKNSWVQQQQDDGSRNTKNRLGPGSPARKRPGSPTLEFAARNQRLKFHQLQSKPAEAFPKSNLSLLGHRNAIQQDNIASKSNPLGFLATVSTRNNYRDRACPAISDKILEPGFKHENNEMPKDPLPNTFWSYPEIPLISSIACNCPFCNAKFTGKYQRGNLARHTRLGHGILEKVYKCEGQGCEKSFRRKDARLKHQRKHHSELDPFFARKPRSSKLSAMLLDGEFPIEIGHPSSPQQRTPELPEHLTRVRSVRSLRNLPAGPIQKHPIIESTSSYNSYTISQDMTAGIKCRNKDILSRLRPINLQGPS
jgi:hypothetical protein